MRDYQTQALAALREAREAAPDVTRLAIEMATGLGKTITFAAELDEWLTEPIRIRDSRTTERALVLVHTDELIRQAVNKIRFVTKGRWTIGVVKAGRNEVDADIVVASVQTLIQPGRKEQIQDVGKIIVDEAHHAAAKSYLDILTYFGALPDCDHAGRDEHGCWDCRNTGFTAPPVPVTGYSATLSRTDGQGLGHVFQDLAFSRSLSWGIRHGYLLDFTPWTIKIPGLDTSGSDAALDASLAESIAPEAVVEAWWTHTRRPLCPECVDANQQTSADVGYPVLAGFCPDGCGTVDPSPSTVLFAPLVRSAEAFAAAFNAAGVKAEVVAGAYSDEHNRAVLARYEAGITTVVCNAMKLTEGFDSPRTMCVVVARPTQSVNLLIQMLGRGLRPWLDASAPPREQQHAILLSVQGTVQDVRNVADLSTKIGTARDGVSFLAMEDEFDLGRDIEPDAVQYAGPVRVEQWDAMVQASSKAWKYTAGGVPFLPTAKRSEGYVFVVETRRGWEVWERVPAQGATSYGVRRLVIAPDLELAMAAAEDEAQERGGDIGALLADKTRPWRKGMPSADMQGHAQRLGLGKELISIMESRAGGKAGKLSDLISRVEASKALDHNAEKIRERARA
jgi:superfamily II DNA or RNA helicase